MEEILDWRDNFKADLPIYFNHVYTPEHFSCKVLPPEVKEAIVEKYKNNTHPDIVSSVKYCTDVNYDLDKLNMFFKRAKISS